MQKIQRQVWKRLVDECPDCGGDVTIIGNGGYRAPKCGECLWTLTTDRAGTMVEESDEFQVTGQ